MKNKKTAYLVAALLGALLLVGPALARQIGLSGTFLRVGSQEGRGGTPGSTAGVVQARIHYIVK